MEVDAASGTVVHHSVPEKPQGPEVSFEEHLAGLKTDKERAEARFQEQVRTEKEKKRILKEKFQDLVQKAKDDGLEGTPEVRDFDLD